MSEKRLSFIIDPSKAKRGSDKIKEYLSSISKQADKIQKALTFDIKLGSTGLGEFAKVTNNLEEIARVSGKTNSEFAKFEKQLEDVRKRIAFYNTESGKQLILERQKASEIVKSTKALSTSNTQMTAAERASANLAKSIQFWQQRQKDLNSEQYQTLIRLRESSRQLEAYQKSMVNAISPAQRLAKSQQELRNNIRDTISQLRLASSVDGKRNTELRAQLSLQKQLAQSEARLKQAYTEEYAQLIRNNEAIKKRRRELLGLDDAQRKAVRSAGEIGSSFGALSGALGVFTGGYFVRTLVEVADAYTMIQNRLAVVSSSTTDLTQATRDLLNISIDSRTELDSTMDVYAKLIRVTKDYNVSQQQLYQVTETVSKAVAMSGASAQGAQGALLQFSQALSGDFQAAAQELNSIIEQTPALAMLIADALNSVDASLDANIGNLKRLAQDGRISTETLIQGILNVKDKIDNQFNNSVRTVSQSITSLKDSFTVAFGELDRAFGGSGSIAESIVNLAKNVDEFTSTIVGATAAVATFAGVAGLGALLAVLTPVGRAITAVSAALSSFVFDFTEASVKLALTEQKTEDLTKRNEALAKSIRGISAAYAGVEYGVIETDIFTVTDELEEAGSELRNISEQIKAAQNDVLTANLLEFSQTLETLDNLNAQYEEQSELVDRLKQKLSELQVAAERAFNPAATSTGLFDNASKVLDEMLVSLDPTAKAWDEYNEAIERVATSMDQLSEEDALKLQGKQAEVLTLLWEKLEKALEGSADAVGVLSDEFKYFRGNLDPVYAVQLDYNKAMETLNKHVQESNPLWGQLADAIRNNYTTALEEASRQTTIGLQGLQNKLRETTEYLSSRVQGGQDTGVVSMENITRSRDAGPEGRTSSAFEGMASEFVRKLDQGILGPKGAAEMLVGLRSYADKLGALGEGFDVEGMRGAVMNLAALAKESFGTENLTDLSADELTQVFEKAQQEAKEREANDLRIREENNTYLQQIAEWATSQKDMEDKSPKGSLTINLNKENGTTVTGVVSGDSEFLEKLTNTLKGVSTAV